MIGIDSVAGSDLMPPRRLVAVHDRQLNIHQDQIGTLPCHGRQRVLTVLGFDQLVTGIAEQIAQDRRLSS